MGWPDAAVFLIGGAVIIVIVLADSLPDIIRAWRGRRDEDE